MNILELVDEVVNDRMWEKSEVKIALDYDKFVDILAVEYDEKNQRVILWP